MIQKLRFYIAPLLVMAFLLTSWPALSLDHAYQPDSKFYSILYDGGAIAMPQSGQGGQTDSFPISLEPDKNPPDIALALMDHDVIDCATFNCTDNRLQKWPSKGTYASYRPRAPPG